MAHYETWKLWLKKISPMGPVFEPRDSSALVAMAEALAMAAPQGPQGVPCVDECRCDDVAHVTEIYETLLEEGYAPQADAKFMDALATALRMDRLQNARSARDWERDKRSLAKFRNVVSEASTTVAHARELYPRTWAVIKENV